MAEITITGENFEREVVKSDKPVLLDFWASWCGPCMMVAPILKEIADEYEGKVCIGKVNVDEQPALADKFNISSIPTLVLMKNGKIVQTSVGFKPKAQIEAMLL